MHWALQPLTKILDCFSIEISMLHNLFTNSLFLFIFSIVYTVKHKFDRKKHTLQL
jgi:hypothetical protein